MLEELKEKVYKANLQLVEYGLVVLTWGNASEIDREKGLFVIKPSGVPYNTMKPSDMVVMDLNGNKIGVEYLLALPLVHTQKIRLTKQLHAKQQIYDQILEHIS